jgi:hypothetical protein
VHQRSFLLVDAGRISIVTGLVLLSMRPDIGLIPSNLAVVTVTSYRPGFSKTITPCGQNHPSTGVTFYLV